MKRTFSLSALTWLTLGFGGIGIVLRMILFSTGLDRKGLLVPGHIADTFVWILTIGFITVLYLLCRRMPKSNSSKFFFSPSRLSLLGCILGGLGILINAGLELWTHRDWIGILSGILGLLCFPALIGIGYKQLKNTRASFLLSLTVCLYFAIRLILQYRFWSADPQIEDYCFQLLAGVALMLVSYQHTAFGVGSRNFRALSFWSLAAVYFCCLSIPFCDTALLYIAWGFWAWTTLSPLQRTAAPDQEL